MAFAEQGRFIEAKEIARGVQRVSLVVNIFEFHYLIAHEDLAGAENIADKFIEQDPGISAGMFEILALKYVKAGKVIENLTALKKITSRWREYRYRAQIMSIVTLLRSGDAGAAQIIVNQFRNKLWKNFALSLIEILPAEINNADKVSKLNDMLDLAYELKYKVTSEDIKIWLHVSFNSGLIQLGNTEAILDFLDNMYQFEFSEVLQAETVANKAVAGQIENALIILGELEDKEDLSNAISLICCRLENYPMDIKFKSIQGLLEFARPRGLEFIIETASKIASLTFDSNERKNGSKHIWETFCLVSQLPNWLRSRPFLSVSF